MIVRVASAGATLRLGGLLAGLLAGRGSLPPLLLEGSLGAGKTTLVRGLVAGLPNASAAEVSSPSFNIVNFYPTRPEVAHFDLYRLEGRPPPEALFEALDRPDLWVIVEWAGHLDRRHWPEDALLVSLKPEPKPAAETRSIELAAAGPRAASILEEIESALPGLLKSLESEGVSIR